MGLFNSGNTLNSENKMQSDIERLKNNGAEENAILGALGAFLFALAGGALWILLDRVGFVAGLSGFVAVIAAVKGYTVFGKKISKKGLVISVIMAFLVLILAWYITLTWDVHSAYKEWFAEGEIERVPSFFECFLIAFRFLSDKSIALSYLGTLGLGLLFAVIGSVSYIAKYSKALKAAETTPPAGSANYNYNYDYNYNTAADPAAPESRADPQDYTADQIREDAPETPAAAENTFNQ